MTPVNNTEFVDTPEEKKEVAEALKQMRERRKGNSPTKKVFKWSKRGLILFKVLLFLLEFLVCTGVLYLLLPLATNIPLTYINTFSITLLLYLTKAWVKR